MNPRLHFWACVAFAAAGFVTSALVALSGSPAVVGLTLATGYVLGGFGHWSLIATIAKRDTWQHVAIAAAWPLVDLWLLAFALLPAPRDEERAS